MYSCTLSLTSTFDGRGRSTPRPGRFPSGKIRYPLYRRLGGPQDWSGQVRKISPPPGFDTRTDQSVASYHTDCYATCINYPLMNGILFLYCIDLLVFITEMESVYCAERTGSLNVRIIQVNFRL
jgi:hypothetical protein